MMLNSYGEFLNKSAQIISATQDEISDAAGRLQKEVNYMNGITISPEELRSSASEMRTKLAAMKENLQTSSNVMNQTSGSYESASGEALRQKYNELKGKFDAFCNVVETQIAFLEMTANSYEQADETIAKEANDAF